MDASIDLTRFGVTVRAMVRPATRPLVTLVDDSVEDLFLIERALAKADLPIEVMPFTQSEEAMDFLGNLVRSRVPIPKNSVLLADIKMPGLDGFALVEWVRAQEELKTLRVFFVTGSNESPDRERAKKLNVDGYCVKFPTPDVLRRIVENNGPVAVCDV